MPLIQFTRWVLVRHPFLPRSERPVFRRTTSGRGWIAYLHQYRPFGVFVYGWNNADSYGYPGGCSMYRWHGQQRNHYTATARDPQCFNALLYRACRRQFHEPVAGVLVTFISAGWAMYRDCYTDASEMPSIAMQERVPLPEPTIFMQNCLAIVRPPQRQTGPTTRPVQTPRMAEVLGATRKVAEVSPLHTDRSHSSFRSIGT